MQANNFCKYVKVFQTTVFVAVWISWIFYFWIFSVLCKVILLSWLIIACGTVVISDRWTILEITKDLKTLTFLQLLIFSYAIALEHFQFLRYGFQNSFHVLVFYCRRNVHEVFSQLHATECHIYLFQCTQSGYFAFCSVRT